MKEKNIIRFTCRLTFAVNPVSSIKRIGHERGQYARGAMDKLPA